MQLNAGVVAPVAQPPHPELPNPQAQGPTLKRARKYDLLSYKKNRGGISSSGSSSQLTVEGHADAYLEEETDFSSNELGSTLTYYNVRSERNYWFFKLIIFLIW